MVTEGCGLPKQFLLDVTSFVGAVELVDVSGKLPGLVYNQGLTKWKVFYSIKSNFNIFQNNVFWLIWPMASSVNVIGLHRRRCCRPRPTSSV